MLTPVYAVGATSFAEARPEWDWTPLGDYRRVMLSPSPKSLLALTMTHMMMLGIATAVNLRPHVYESGCNVDAIANPALRAGCRRFCRLSVQSCGLDPMGRLAPQFSG